MTIGITTAVSFASKFKAHIENTAALSDENKATIGQKLTAKLEKADPAQSEDVPSNAAYKWYLADDETKTAVSETAEYTPDRVGRDYVVEITSATYAGAITVHTGEIQDIPPVVKDATLGKSAFATRAETDESKKVVVNESPTGAKDLESNYASGANKGKWQGVAVMEFEIPATDPDKITGAELTLNVSNANKSARAYSVFKTKDGTALETGTTYDQIMAKSGGDLIYAGGSVNGGSTEKPTERTDKITDARLVDYVKSVANSGEAKTIQIVVSDSAQTIKVLMAEGKAPTLKLSTTTKEVKNITVEYVDSEGTTLTPSSKDGTDHPKPTTVTGFVGEVYEATADMTATFHDNDGKKWEVDTTADGYKAEVKPTAESQADDLKLKLVFKEVQKYPVTFKTQIGEQAAETVTTEQVYDGDSITKAFAKYLTDESGKVTAVCATTEKDDKSNPKYELTATSAEGGVEAVMPYTAPAGDNDMYFAEAENIPGNTKDTSNGSNGYGMSMGYGVNIADKSSAGTVAIVVPADGKYKVTVAAVNRNVNKANVGVSVYKNSTSEAAIVENTAVDATWKAPKLVSTTADVELLEGDKILVMDTGTDNNYVTLDYTLLERTGDSTKKSTPAKAQTTDPTAADVQVKATYGRVPQAHNLGSSFANKSASDLGTFTAEDINGDLKISGTATKVDIGKGDNYYVPVRITLPKSGAYESTAPAANSKVLIYQKGTAIPSNWTADGNTIKDFSNQFQATSEFDTAWAADILLTCAELPETNKFYFKLDLDGDGEVYEPRIITVDVSGVTKAE